MRKGESYVSKEKARAVEKQRALVERDTELWSRETEIEPAERERQRERERERERERQLRSRERQR